MNNPSVMTNKALRTTTSWFSKINDFLKGFGIITGGLAASLADWITGSIALGVLFYGADLPVPAWIIGTIWSMGSWGVQLLLWEMILSGKASKLWNNSAIGHRVTLVAVIVLKFLDDAVDLMAIYYMIYKSPLEAMVENETVYTIFIVVVYALSYILVGFSEVFVSFAIYALNENKSFEVEKTVKSRRNAHYANPAWDMDNERDMAILDTLGGRRT